MVTKPEHTTSEEIGTATSNIKELQKNPILIPISDYIKGSSIFEKEDEREISNLTSKSGSLKLLQQTGIYDDSRIAIIYSEVVSLWERIAWIYKKNVSLANTQIAQIKSVVEKFYITLEESDRRIAILEKELKESKEKNKAEKDKDTESKNLSPYQLKKLQKEEQKEQEAEEENYLKRKLNERQ